MINVEFNDSVSVKNDPTKCGLLSFVPKLYDTIVCGSKSGDKTKVSITGATVVISLLKNNVSPPEIPGIPCAPVGPVNPV